MKKYMKNFYIIMDILKNLKNVIINIGQGFNKKQFFLFFLSKNKITTNLLIIISFLNELNAKDCYDKLKNDYNQSISLISVKKI